jgi:hypothetical protein
LKATRKLILVTTDWRLYEGTTKVSNLNPWEGSSLTYSDALLELLPA